MNLIKVLVLSFFIEKSNKKLYIGASLIAVLLIILLFIQFSDDEPDQVEIVESEKAAIETVTENREQLTTPLIEKLVEAITLKTITSQKGDNLWDRYRIVPRMLCN